jgi:hypothetical protein
VLAYDTVAAMFHGSSRSTERLVWTLWGCCRLKSTPPAPRPPGPSGNTRGIWKLPLARVVAEYGQLSPRIAEPNVAISYRTAAPPRTAVLPSPPTSHAKPARGLKFVYDGLLNSLPGSLACRQNRASAQVGFASTARLRIVLTRPLSSSGSVMNS